MPFHTFSLFTSHHPNSLSFTVYAHLQCFCKKPLHSFFFSSFLLFFLHILFVHTTFTLWFFQSYCLFCHVPLHSVMLNILLCPHFLHVSSNYYCPFSSFHFTFPFLWCSCYVFPLNVIVSHCFSLSVLFLSSSVSISWILPICEKVDFLTL